MLQANAPAYRVQIHLIRRSLGCSLRKDMFVKFPRGGGGGQDLFFSLKSKLNDSLGWKDELFFKSFFRSILDQNKREC